MSKINRYPIFNRFKWVFMILILFSAFTANAQSQSSDNSTLMVGAIIVAIVALIMIGVAGYALRVLNVVIRKEEERRAKESGEEPKPEASFWQRFLRLANNRVDMEEEDTIILEHDYDGIRELDNHLPPWWSYLFYATIVFGIVYVILYHVTDTFPLQEEEYEIEMAEAAALAEMRQAESQADGTAFTEADLEMTTDADILASGAKLYSQQCAVCHKADGGGSIGPNLTDDYWLHGGDINSVYNTIKVGVPDKGMISWEAMLSPEQMRDVSNYIKSLGGTNPPGAKAPQGKLDGEGSGETIAVAELEDDSAVTTQSGGAGEAKTTFMGLCAACHLADGGGLIGPNLTDKYWKDSDGSLEGIIKTITDGVEGTTMVSWKASYSADQIEELAKYILALQGTTPANPKAPEGDLIEN